MYIVPSQQTDLLSLGQGCDKTCHEMNVTEERDKWIMNHVEENKSKATSEETTERDIGDENKRELRC
jgi:hypothetical protein